jgi:hypothetical protein
MISTHLWWMNWDGFPRVSTVRWWGMRSMMWMGIASIRRSTRTVGLMQKTVNTGVFTRGQDNVEYYGRLQNVYELTFHKGPHHLTLVVFRCHWFDPDGGHRTIPSIGLVEVRPSTTYRGSDVFIVAHQAAQVHYLPYPCHKEELKG